MSENDEVYTVSQAARLAGVTRKAIRVYESKGLLPPARRTEAGYRQFTDVDIATLRFVRRSRALGLRVDEIKDILDLQRGGQQPCAQVVATLDRHLADLDRTLADLHALRDRLADVRAQAEDNQRSGRSATVCRIIETAPDSTTGS